MFLGLHDLAKLEHRGKHFIATTQPIDTTAPTGRLMLQILGAFAEFERELLRVRTKEGMARARAEGKKIGRPRKTR